MPRILVDAAMRVHLVALSDGPEHGCQPKFLFPQDRMQPQPESRGSGDKLAFSAQGIVAEERCLRGGWKHSATA